MILHGWEKVADSLHEKSLRGAWNAMSTKISDEMLNEFAVEESLDQSPDMLKTRYKDVANRVLLYMPLRATPDRKRFVKGFRNMW